MWLVCFLGSLQEKIRWSELCLFAGNIALWLFGDFYFCKLVTRGIKKMRDVCGQKDSIFSISYFKENDEYFCVFNRFCCRNVNTKWFW